MRYLALTALILFSTSVFAQSSDWHFSLGLGYSYNARYISDGGTATVSGTSSSLKSDLTYKNAFTLFLEARMLPANSWGFIGGLQYDGERELDSGTLTIGGVSSSVTGGSSPSKVQMSVIYGSAAYRWEQFYIPFGLNLSIPKFTAAGGSTGTADVNGGVGAQFGVGYTINDNFAVELQGRSATMKLTTTTPSSSADYGTGFFATGLIAGKYIF